MLSLHLPDLPCRACFGHPSGFVGCGLQGYRRWLWGCTLVLRPPQPTDPLATQPLAPHSLPSGLPATRTLLLHLNLTLRVPGQSQPRLVLVGLRPGASCPAPLAGVCVLEGAGVRGRGS